MRNRGKEEKIECLVVLKDEEQKNRGEENRVFGSLKEEEHRTRQEEEESECLVVCST